MRLLCLLLLGVGLAATVAVDARASSDPPASKATAALTSRVANASSLLAWRPRAWSPAGRNPRAGEGLRVAIDPVDGAYGMPPADEFSQSVVLADDAPVSVVRRANGSGFARLDDRFAEFAVVALGADGRPRWTCVHGTSGAATFMHAPKVAPPGGSVWEEK